MARIRRVTDAVTQAARPLDLNQFADLFTSRGPWRRLLDIVDVNSLARLAA